MPILVLLGVLAVGVVLLAGQPARPHAPPPLRLGGQLAALVQVMPAVAARIRGAR